MVERQVLIAAWGALAAVLAGCAPAAIPEQQPAVVSPAAAGAAIITVDVPEGMDIVPGGAALGIDLYRTGNVGSGRYFPMIWDRDAPAGGRTDAARLQARGVADGGLAGAPRRGGPPRSR